MPGAGGVSNTPAAVEFNSNLYAFYQRNQTFYYRSMTEVWTSEAQVPETGGVNAGVCGPRVQWPHLSVLTRTPARPS